MTPIAPIYGAIGAMLAWFAGKQGQGSWVCPGCWPLVLCHNCEYAAQFSGEDTLCVKSDYAANMCQSDRDMTKYWLNFRVLLAHENIA